MRRLWQALKETWHDLNRSIYIGERYEKNTHGIVFGASLVLVINLITCYTNWRKGLIGEMVSGLVCILTAALIIYFILVRKNRPAAVTTAMLAMILTYTYDALFDPNGVIILWTLLFPLGFCYLASVRHGIWISLWFLALSFILFRTPLLSFALKNYDEGVIARFPLVYLADVIITVYIMVQYHKNTLQQMDYAEQILAAKEAAVEANTAKSEFLANMSHEIRTPINAVLGMNEMILRESDQARNDQGHAGDPFRDTFNNINIYAQNIENAGNNLLAIINDILDFSKIEAGKMDIVDGKYRLSSLVHDLSNLILFQAREKGLDFIIHVDETLPDELYGDIVRVRQIFVNLLNNAVKYTERGSVTLTLRGEMPGPGEPENRLRLIATVEDTGIGIREEDIGRLFMKFERVDLEQNGTVEGTGLGLSIAYSLLTKMGGSIDVRSEYGKGSVFTIVIPQKMLSTEPVGDIGARIHANALAPAIHNRIQAPGARILIVDDTKMNLTVAVGLLRNTQIQIETAAGGEEAIALTQKNAFDLILMDQRMPKMDGTETMRLIRAQTDGANRTTPIVCMTADAIIGARDRYLAEGFTDYLTKPVDGRALEDMLMKYLPDGKVVLVTDSGETGEPQPVGNYAPLRGADIDPAVGIGYCQGDEALYRSLLQDYLQCAGERAQGLARCYDEHDLKAYAILAHTVKSSSKTIGAAALSGLAAEMEAAADADNLAAHQRDHQRLLEKYSATAAAIRSVVPLPQEKYDDGEIMEFLPE